MALFSHSQLETFQQCKLKYKFKYIDKVVVEVPKTIEAFFGDIIHQALRELYEHIKAGKRIPDLADVQRYFLEQWKAQWDDAILINGGKTKQEYVEVGISFLEHFYTLYFPFDQYEVIGLETNDKYDLPNGDRYYVRIDKLARIGNNYLICDYKTAKKLPSKDQMKKDRQLAMYGLWVKNKFSDCHNVHLIWYYLAHNEKIEIVPSQDELTAIQNETMRIIGEIKVANEYPPKVTRLCDWCVYKSICPAWNSPIATEKPKITKQSTLDLF